MNTFKDTNIQITFKPANKIGNYLNNYSKQIEYTKNSGVYELTCHTCKNSYIGQTSRDLYRIELRGHIRLTKSDRRWHNTHHPLYGPSHSSTKSTTDGRRGSLSMPYIQLLVLVSATYRSSTHFSNHTYCVTAGCASE